MSALCAYMHCHSATGPVIIMQQLEPDSPCAFSIV